MSVRLRRGLHTCARCAQPHPVGQDFVNLLEQFRRNSNFLRIALRHEGEIFFG